MEIRIMETNKVEELTIADENGIEWTEDLIAVSNFWNEEKEEFEMSQDDFDWWNEYITDYKRDKEESDDLADKMSADKSEMWEKVNEQTAYCDMDLHSDARREALEEIMESLKYTNNIQELLNDRDTSIMQMSKDLSMDYSIAHKLATRDSLKTISLGRLLEIAEYLKVDIEDLYTNEEGMKMKKEIGILNKAIDLVAKNSHTGDAGDKVYECLNGLTDDAEEYGVLDNELLSNVKDAILASAKHAGYTNVQYSLMDDVREILDEV